MAEQEEAHAGEMWLYKVGVPRFSLILWFNPFSEGKLRLPKGFSKEHGAEIANQVLLKLPNGAEWQVCVVRGRKRIWLSISSPKATTKPSLKPHEPRRKNVKGRTASVEKLDGSGKQGNTSPATESDTTCRLNKHGHSPKTRDKPLLASSQPHKPRRTNGMERTASSSKGQNRSRTSSKPTEEASPLARAKAVFKSENPFFMHAPEKFF
ncbi:hypothetical protein LINPERHAP1_LOCUS36515 [Linum perenne]